RPSWAGSCRPDRAPAWLRPARPHRWGSAVRALQHETVRREGARQIVQALQTEALEELPCRSIQDGPTGSLFATPLLDQPARRERVNRLIAVHPTDRFDLGTGHRLFVRDHREGLQGGRRYSETVRAEVGRDPRGVLG